MSDISENIVEDILNKLKESSDFDIIQLKKNVGLTQPILPYLLWLEEMNFADRKTQSDKFKLISSKWNITKAGKVYLDFIKSNKIIKKPDAIKFSLVHVSPIELTNVLKKSTLPIVDVLEDLFSTAKDEILISSPYIDPVIFPFIDKVSNNVDIKILTQSKENFLTRLESQNKTLKVKTLKEFRSGVQLYQVHAKFICVDENFSIIMSANLNERSLYNNFEIGIVIEDQYITKTLKSLFYSFFNLNR